MRYLLSPYLSFEKRLYCEHQATRNQNKTETILVLFFFMVDEWKNHSFLLTFRLMKIWVAWTFSSGKTTLASQFDNAILNVEREAMQWKPVGEMTKEEIIAFQYRVAEMQYSREQEAGEFITDNPLYLSPAYCLQIDPFLYNWSLNFVKEKAKYDLICVCEPLPIEIDGIRHSDDNFQKKIHTDLIDVLNYFDVPFKFISWSVEERKKQLLSLVR